MSQENVEIVRQAFEANRSGSTADTVDKAVAVSDPSCEFTSRLTSVEGRVYRGHDGVRVYFQDLADAFQEWRNDLDEITEVGPDAVLTEGVFRGTGKSGVNVELRSVMVWRLSNGYVVELHAYPSREAALEAAGLS